MFHCLENGYEVNKVYSVLLAQPVTFDNLLSNDSLNLLLYF